MKSQQVRLLDVFVLGPVMVYAGVRLVRHRERGLGLFLAAAGIGTVLYNWRNYERYSTAVRHC